MSELTEVRADELAGRHVGCSIGGVLWKEGRRELVAVHAEPSLDGDLLVRVEVRDGGRTVVEHWLDADYVVTVTR
jgi:hypothetical protein